MVAGAGFEPAIPQARDDEPWFSPLIDAPNPEKAAKLDGERDYPRSKGNLPKFRPRTGADGVFSHCSSSVA